MSRSAVPPRIRWAVEVLDPRPGEALLEIGCGPGVAAELVCARLAADFAPGSACRGGGTLLAVDRSAVAVGRAARRNAGHVAAGRLTVCRAELGSLEVPEGSFDAAYAIDVNVFWTDPAGPAVTVLARALRPGGRLLICYGAGSPTTGGRLTDPIAAAMTAAGLTGVGVLTGPAGTGVTGRR